jgi:hypothetical protein
LKQFWRQRVIEPMRRILLDGASAGKIAVSLSVGAMIGIWPIPWTSTAACAVVGPVLRLHIPSLLFANFMVTSLQYLLLIPFLQAGAWLFQAGPLPFSLDQVKAVLAQGVGHTMSVLGGSILRAFVVWLLITPVVVTLLYLVLKPLMARLKARAVEAQA